MYVLYLYFLFFYNTYQSLLHQDFYCVNVFIIECFYVAQFIPIFY